ncbi:hypothetical protein AA0119_g11732 [Alternaria tenuissima]|uniref:Uncharacterized protein n=1 Tax=Alternaria tenuissima TaxID=119927 RepID=A0ABY0FVH2_9PLEO|nr:hypothetical protein AA0119_g11732 [Alternaria tenuissima]
MANRANGAFSVSMAASAASGIRGQMGPGRNRWFYGTFLTGKCLIWTIGYSTFHSVTTCRLNSSSV